MALGSSPGLAHHPKMGATGYILQRVFEPPSDSKLGPAGPIAVNDPSLACVDFFCFLEARESFPGWTRRTLEKQEGELDAKDWVICKYTYALHPGPPHRANTRLAGSG